jgi:hypothetical protein
MRGTTTLFQRFSQPLHDELDIPGLKLSPAFDFGLISILWVFFEILFGELSRERLFFGELHSDEWILHPHIKARARLASNSIWVLPNTRDDIACHSSGGSLLNLGYQ